MKRLKAGPELKMPELKVPGFLVDLYWDLRDRRLLPLVGLAIVAIVAVPFLLGGGSESESNTGVSSLGAPPSPESRSARLTVVQAKPGLRAPKRLRNDHPTDPFVQRYTSADLKGAKLGGGEESAASSTSSSTSTSTSTTVTKTSSSGTTEVTTETSGSPAAPGVPPHLTLYAPAIDVKTIRTETNPDGTKQTSDPVIRHRVLPPAALPSEKEQAVTYMGISSKTEAAMLLISDAVTAVFGEAKCLSGESACQLIEVEPGMPMTFVYGADSVRYKITVLKLEPVVAGHR
ncbi:MAG TPA: hypothetical protein VNS60_13690 [Solirubrobacterales bacterium]|nr:hypothetical protein [Solirubrobacterales bacterium]